jgi:hypothetical protein
MKPPLPHSESAVPRTLHAQLEIAKAMRMLMAPDDDEPLRQRRAEIVALRRDLEVLAGDVRKAFEEAAALAKAELRVALAKKYNPDQPRVPVGNRDGGQWTSGSEAGSEASSESVPLFDGTAVESSETRVRYASLENSPGGGRADAINGNTPDAPPRYAQDIPPGWLD